MEAMTFVAPGFCLDAPSKVPHWLQDIPIKEPFEKLKWPCPFKDDIPGVAFTKSKDSSCLELGRVARPNLGWFLRSACYSAGLGVVLSPKNSLKLGRVLWNRWQACLTTLISHLCLTLVLSCPEKLRLRLTGLGVSLPSPGVGLLPRPLPGDILRISHAREFGLRVEHF